MQGAFASVEAGLDLQVLMSRWRQLQAINRNPDEDEQRASAEGFSEELQRQSSEELQ